MTSRMQLTPEKITSVLKGAAIAASGAILTHLTEFVTSTDFGQWTPAVVAIASVAVNAVRKLLVQE